MPKKKTKTRKPEAEVPSDKPQQPDFAVQFLRLLPCPGAHAFHIFSSLKLQPPKLEKVFMACAIGPNLTDIHAMGAVGVMRDAGLRAIEILQAFAIDRASYIALCEGIRAVLSPLGFVRFEGDVNMLTVTTPVRVLESLPFYEPVDPNLPTM